MAGDLPGGSPTQFIALREFLVSKYELPEVANMLLAR